MAHWAEFSPTRLLKVLVAHGVDFVAVGGIAMIAHGSARFTQDLDICYANDDANLDVLGAALVELGATPRGVADAVPFVPDGRTLRGTTILTLTTREGPIDLLRQPSGAPAYAELRQRAMRFDLDGVGVLVASLDDLEAMKRTAGRPKDQIDLEEISAIRQLMGRSG